ncbi:MAG: hypothetical protein AAFV85_08425, partial [Cyanobacteria bacterium J06634_6]
LEQREHRVSQLEKLLEKRSDFPDVGLQHKWERAKVAEFYTSDLELIDYCISLIEMLGKQSSSMGTEMELIGLDEGWRQIKKAAVIMHNRVALLNSPTQQDLELALRWMAAQGESNDLALLERIDGNLSYESENIRNLLEVARRKISERLQNSAFDDSQEYYGSRVKENTPRLPGQRNNRQIFWARADRVAIITIGGLSLGAAIAQLPGAIIVGISALILGWRSAFPRHSQKSPNRDV